MGKGNRPQRPPNWLVRGLTTGCVKRIEQCVCHEDGTSPASRRTTDELECRPEGCAISRATIMKRPAPALDRDALSAEIVGLSKVRIADLRERWKSLYGKEPSGRLGRSF